MERILPDARYLFRFGEVILSFWVMFDIGPPPLSPPSPPAPYALYELDYPACSGGYWIVLVYKVLKINLEMAIQWAFLQWE